MKNIIIGKSSNLSNYLSTVLSSSDVLSSREILNSLDNVFDKYKNQKINLILNCFQPATKINDFSNPYEYINNSIVVTSKILSLLKGLDINKIIYTSSSSVYGDNPYCKETDLLSPLNLHASLKVANEKMIEKYCMDNKINYHIIRLFNMYGGNDTFSVISKIIKSYKNNEVLKIVNNGSSIRDFIHITDVINLYRYIIENSVSYPILNIGSGKGISISIVLEFLEVHGIKIKTSNIISNEIKISTACTERIKSISDTDSFIDVKKFILSNLI